jgi:hypothetical protein
MPVVTNCPPCTTCMTALQLCYLVQEDHYRSLHPDDPGETTWPQILTPNQKTTGTSTRIQSCQQTTGNISERERKNKCAHSERTGARTTERCRCPLSPLLHMSSVPGGHKHIYICLYFICFLHCSVYIYEQSAFIGSAATVHVFRRPSEAQGLCIHHASIYIRVMFVTWFRSYV